MDLSDIVVELWIDRVSSSSYGWTAAFRERPGDSLCAGDGEHSYGGCLASVAENLPDGTLVEVRVGGICAGTWPSERIQANAKAVGDEIHQRLATLGF